MSYKEQRFSAFKGVVPWDCQQIRYFLQFSTLYHDCTQCTVGYILFWEKKEITTTTFDILLF